MKTRKEQQMLIASILLEIGMEDALVGAVTNLQVQDFQHLKK